MDKSQGSDDFQVSNSVVIQNVIIWLQTCLTAVIAVLLYFCIFHQPAEKYGSSTTLNPIYTQIDQQLNNSTYITTGAKPTKPEYVAPIIWSIACCVCIIIALRIYNSVKKPVVIILKYVFIQSWIFIHSPSFLGKQYFTGVGSAVSFHSSGAPVCNWY